MNWTVRVALLLGLLMMADRAEAVICLGQTVVSGTTVNFQNYNPLSGSPKTASGTVTVGCNGIGVLSGYTISLSIGPGSSYFARELVSGTNRLSYNLYKDDGTVWGNGLGGTGVNAYGGLLSLSTVDYNVNGRIPAGQDKPAGTYTATITITVDLI